MSNLSHVLNPLVAKTSRFKVLVDHATEPALEVRQNGAGDLAQFSSAGTGKLFVDDEGYLIIAVVAAPADGALSASEVALWFDATNGAGKLKIKGKTANGTVVAGEVTLS